MYFFLFWKLKSLCVKFKKRQNWHKVKEWWTSTCIKHVISKPFDTVLLCYLVLNAFLWAFVGFLWGESFFHLEQVLSLI